MVDGLENDGTSFKWFPIAKNDFRLDEVDPHAAGSEFSLNDAYYDTRDGEKDLNVIFPLERLGELAGEERLVLVCGRYEGVDQRVIDLAVDEELSVGDYVLSGGEIPAMAVIEGLVRLLPGVLGNPESAARESFREDLLEGPQYTRPPIYRGLLGSPRPHRRAAQQRGHRGG